MLSLADLPVGIQGNRYFCRVSLDGKKLNDSQEVRLHSEDIIGSVLPPCGMNESVQSSLIRRCIDPMTVPDEPGTPQLKPTTTQPTTKVPRPTSLHVPNATILYPPVTPESSGPGPTDNPGVPDGDGDTNVADTALNSEEKILIYTAIGVAVFLILVIFILSVVVCVCLWNSMFRQSKHCTICGSSAVPFTLHHPTKI